MIFCDEDRVQLSHSQRNPHFLSFSRYSVPSCAGTYMLLGHLAVHVPALSCSCRRYILELTQLTPPLVA